VNGDELTVQFRQRFNFNHLLTERERLTRASD
jgi:hypothetical protein